MRLAFAMLLSLAVSLMLISCNSESAPLSPSPVATATISVSTTTPPPATATQVATLAATTPSPTLVGGSLPDGSNAAEMITEANMAMRKLGSYHIESFAVLDNGDLKISGDYSKSASSYTLKAGNTTVEVITIDARTYMRLNGADWQYTTDASLSADIDFVTKSFDESTLKASDQPAQYQAIGREIIDGSSTIQIEVVRSTSGDNLTADYWIDSQPGPYGRLVHKLTMTNASVGSTYKNVYSNFDAPLNIVAPLP